MLPFWFKMDPDAVQMVKKKRSTQVRHSSRAHGLPPGRQRLAEVGAASPSAAEQWACGEGAATSPPNKRVESQSYVRVFACEPLTLQVASCFLKEDMCWLHNGWEK